MSLVLANALLIVMVLLEIGFLTFFEKEEVPWKEIIFNLNSGHILMWVFRGLELGAFHMILTYGSFNLIEGWSYAAQWLFCFIAWDFCFYWLHRFHHKYGFLWAVHVVHHQGEHFSLSLGIRNSWYSSLTSFPFFVGLAFIGVPLEIFIATSSIHYIIQFYNHNRVVKKSGWLEKVMITPSHHRVHHGCNDDYIDKNFGGTLVLWDKLFGTFQPEKEEVPVIFGVKNYEENHNVIAANNIPFLKYLKLPTWFLEKRPPKFRINNYLIATGGILLFGLLLYYIFQENTWGFWQKAGLFAIIFAATIGNGGLSEGKQWGIVLWMSNFLLFAPLFILYNGISDWVFLLNLGVLAIHSLFSWYVVVNQKEVVVLKT